LSFILVIGSRGDGETARQSSAANAGTEANSQEAAPGDFGYSERERARISTRCGLVAGCFGGTGLYRSYIGDIERSKHNPRLSTLEALADAFRIAIGDLTDPPGAMRPKRGPVR
jgi:transcriptional regulator with XRE-family HTH domain